MKYQIALILLLLTHVARAEERCDCTERVGDCTAAVAYAHGLLEITTDTGACAQVLYYIDGQPEVSLVTDGRDVQKRELQPFEVLTAGQCQVCRQRNVSAQQRLQTARRCAPELLMPTTATHTCMRQCNDVSDSNARERCEYNCQQHSRCLEENCVQALRQKLSTCERRCDREMQSSMAADIDRYQRCQAVCETIKEEIRSCPLL